MAHILVARPPMATLWEPGNKESDRWGTGDEKVKNAHWQISRALFIFGR